MPLLNICDRLVASLDAGEKVFHVTTDGRGYMLFEPLLRFVFWVFLKLEGDVFVDSLLIFVLRNKVVLVDTSFERTFFTVEDCGPWLLWIGSGTP